MTRNITRFWVVVKILIKMKIVQDSCVFDSNDDRVQNERPTKLLKMECLENPRQLVGRMNQCPATCVHPPQNVDGSVPMEIGWCTNDSAVRDSYQSRQNVSNSAHQFDDTDRPDEMDIDRCA